MCFSTAPKYFGVQPVLVTCMYAQSSLTLNRLTRPQAHLPSNSSWKDISHRQRYTLCRSSLRHGIVTSRRIYSRSRWMEGDSKLVPSYCGSPLIGTYALTILSMQKLTFDDTAWMSRTHINSLQQLQFSKPFNCCPGTISLGSNSNLRGPSRVQH